ncbi:hypothetical protein FOB80_01775 [Aerococcus viridans]|nr:hypothetical protein FOB80_01775 [Aerococcus viridans]
MENSVESEFRLYHFQSTSDNIKDIEEIDEQIHQIGIFLKESLRVKNLAIFIGSGCSTPEIPMMGVTMTKILSKPENTDILEIVRKYIGANETENFKDIEGLLNWLQNGINFERDRTTRKDLMLIFDKIKEQFIESIPKWGNEKYIKSTTIDTYTKFYKYIFDSRSIENSKLAIFTTNYDLFNEFALENNNFSYTSGFTTDLKQAFDINQFKYRVVDDTERYKDKWQPVKKEANIYKLHGSINWSQNDHGTLCQNNTATENIIIYPTMLKHQETAQSPYSELFREFSTVLQKQNTTLIVMGYGFPDEHINNIISQNLQNQDFNLIILGDIFEDKMKEFYQKFKNKINLHIIGGQIDSSIKGHYFDVIVKKYLSHDKMEEMVEIDESDA